MRRDWLIFPLLLLAAAATPTPGVLKTFGDWIVGCDNGRNCQAVALKPEDSEDDALEITLSRSGMPDARPRISISARRPAAAVKSLTVDGRSFGVAVEGDESFAFIEPQGTLSLMDAIKPAKRLAVLDAKGNEIAHASLVGYSAALLYMDEQQKRLGTVTALIGKGPGTMVPMPPALPVIVSPPTSNREPRKLSARDYLRVTKSLGCDPSDLRRYAAAGNYAYSYRLDAQTTLALFEHPCELGPYSRASFALLIDEKGGVRPTQFDVPPGPDDDYPSNSLANAEWDYNTMQLGEFKKGRGLLDCGTTRDFAWDGVRFRLVAQSDMNECGGSFDFIPTWQATVSRR